MAALSSLDKNSRTASNLLVQLKQEFPAFAFKPGTVFSWSATNQTITYISADLSTNIGIWALLHEVAHADLGHANYEDDFGLLQLEVAAWQHSKVIAGRYNIAISEDHIQDCLDTYRDWLHSRAKCPSCGVVSLQAKDGLYHCFNCKTAWKVPNSQLCRVKRTIIKK